MRIETSSTYRRWMRNLRDARAKMRINARIAQIEHHGALFGDWKPIDHALVELRFHFGPGYRIYASLQGRELLLLVAGGDKTSQARDIAQARMILNEWRKNHD